MGDLSNDGGLRKEKKLTLPVARKLTSPRIEDRVGVGHKKGQGNKKRTNAQEHRMLPNTAGDGEGQVRVVVGQG